jgi:outer membrane autotransporter protein
MRITPALKVSYSHELFGTSQTLALTTPTGSAVAGTTLTPAHNTVTVGPEITAQLNQQLSLYGNYKAVIGIGKSLDNVIFAGARYAF